MSQAELIKELKAMREDLDYIKENMVDKDMILTAEEETNLDTALQEYKEGKTTSLDDLKKELNL